MKVPGLGLCFVFSLSANMMDLGTFGVDPKSSILFANRNPMHPDNPTGPIWIDLDQLAQAHGMDSLVGYRIRFAASGTMSYCLEEMGCKVVPTEGFLAAFTWNDFVSVGAVNLLPTALGLPDGCDSAYPDTFYDHMPTSGGPPDFRIYNDLFTSVIVPGGSHYLAVGLYDSFFRDNNGTVQLTIQVELDSDQVPEPTPAMLSLLGLISLAVFSASRTR